MQDHFLGVGKPRSIQGLFCLTHVVHDEFHGTFLAGRCEQKPKDIHFCMAKHFGYARQSSGAVFAVNGKLIHFWHGPYPLSPAFYIHENAVSAQCSQLREDDSSHVRSEEHTSELQSLRHLVCRLPLEKKKKTYELMNDAVYADP